MEYSAQGIISEQSFERIIEEFCHFMNVIYEFPLSQCKRNLDPRDSTPRKNYLFLPFYTIKEIPSILEELKFDFPEKQLTKKKIYHHKKTRHNYIQLKKLSCSKDLQIQELIREWTQTCFVNLKYSNNTQAEKAFFKYLGLKKSQMDISLKKYIEDVVPYEPIGDKGNTLRKEIFDIYLELKNKEDIEQEDVEDKDTNSKIPRASERSLNWKENPLWLVYRLPLIQDREVNFRKEVKSFKKSKRGYFSMANLDHDLNPRYLELIPATIFERTRLLDLHYGSLLELPSICYRVERFLDVQELSFMHDWGYINPYFLTQAYQNSSFDPEVNYETLETLGDSCLKLVVSFYLFEKDKRATEEDMTIEKVKCINNRYLGAKADALELQFFVRCFKSKNLCFEIPFLNTCKGTFFDLFSLDL